MKFRVEVIGAYSQIIDGAESKEQAEEVMRDITECGDFEIQQVTATEIKEDDTETKQD